MKEFDISEVNRASLDYCQNNVEQHMQKSPSNHLGLESNDFDHLFHTLTLPQPHQLHKDFQGIYSYDSNRACSLETLYLNLLISQSTSPSSRLLHKINGCHGQPHNSWCNKASADMVRITEQLIRKKAEHNELIIGTLEELSLHQEDIERIEHVGRWCRDLKILLLQSNLIPRLENLNRLKKLEYLNVAINNIERIENLEALEALRKLDLTLNFVGELTSVESLRGNYSLRELFLTGNPCTDFPGYREYVITVLPQLEHLDGKEITRSERLRAAREFSSLRERIVQLEALHKIERDEQRVRVQQSIAEQEACVSELPDDDERKASEFWQQKSEHCPETRIQMAKFSRRAKDRSSKETDGPGEKKRKRRLFADCGRPYSLNEPRLDFEFRDEPDRFELDLHLYKYLDTSLIAVDAQPNYVRVTVKGKIFQLALKQDIQTDRSTCQRSETTGHMLIVMPKLNPERIVKPSTVKETAATRTGAGLTGTVDIRNICHASNNSANPTRMSEDEVPDLI
ncbi:protein tilB [Anopheles stephensi]|uniref:protein tilB n=1 Tax=Anopheles stephensi TaxID=30069 RepID=UPI0016589482|nr:protein tilB [Anopheles stephensi]